MLWLLALAVGLDSPCPYGCTLLQTALRGKGESPCGCGFGLVRRVKTRTELEKLSQPDLDAFEREVDAQLDELKGGLDAATESHKKELKEMHQTSEDLNNAMFGKTGEAKAAITKAKADYDAQRKNVTDMEEQVRDLSDKFAAAQAELAVVNGELEAKLFTAQACECDEIETVLARTGHKHKKAKAHAKKASLLVSQAPDLKKIFAIEKVETEIVDILKATQEDQSEYDKEVRLIGHQREQAQLNHTHVTSMGQSDNDLLAKRASAQADAVAALESMVAGKEAAVAAAEKRAGDAKSQTAELDKELSRCGCR